MSTHLLKGKGDMVLKAENRPGFVCSGTEMRSSQLHNADR
jgi:hypothetical protein